MIYGIQRKEEAGDKGWMGKWGRKNKKDRERESERKRMGGRYSGERACRILVGWIVVRGLGK